MFFTRYYFKYSVIHTYIYLINNRLKLYNCKKARPLFILHTHTSYKHVLISHICWIIFRDLHFFIYDVTHKMTDS